MTEIDFGTIISELRSRNRLSQEDLAKELGVHEGTVKNWENNRCTPDAKNICALADFFHITTDSLLGRKEGRSISLPKLTDREYNQLLGIIQSYLDCRVVLEQK